MSFESKDAARKRKRHEREMRQADEDRRESERLETTELGWLLNSCHMDLNGCLEPGYEGPDAAQVMRRLMELIAILNRKITT